MKLITIGGLKQKFFLDALSGVKLPSRLTIAVVADQKRCWSLLRHYPVEIRKRFLELCKHTKTSFSFSRGPRNYILIYLPSNRSKIAKDPAVFRGILMHEFMHLNMNRNIPYASIKVHAQEVLNTLLPRVPKRYRQLFFSVSNSAQLFLRDLYANSSLLRSRYVDDVLSYYHSEFSSKKCPRPMLYENFTEFLRKRPSEIINLFQFEFGLLSIMLPLRKFTRVKADRFVRHMERCYQVNAKELERGCEQIVELFLRSKKLDTVFQHLFFTSIFLQLLAWIDHTG